MQIYNVEIIRWIIFFNKDSNGVPNCGDQQQFYHEHIAHDTH